MWLPSFSRSVAVLASAGALTLVGATLLALAPAAVASDDAATLVERAVAYYRGRASIAEIVMTVHRAGWERTLRLDVRTQGSKNALFVITAPPKDAGAGTLKRGRDVWTYNPRIDRAIKLPPAMMAQPWMGSDFSNDDLAKSDSIVLDYEHTLESTTTCDGVRARVIRSVPRPGAPVVWGMQRLTIRDDLILAVQEFFDEERRLVKTMTSSEIVVLGGKPFPRVWTMRRAGSEDAWTRIEYGSLVFPASLPDVQFTLTALQAGGR